MKREKEERGSKVYSTGKREEGGERKGRGREGGRRGEKRRELKL